LAWLVRQGHLRTGTAALPMLFASCASNASNVNPPPAAPIHRRLLPVLPERSTISLQSIWHLQHSHVTLIIRNPSAYAACAPLTCAAVCELVVNPCTCSTNAPQPLPVLPTAYHKHAFHVASVAQPDDHNAYRSPSFKCCLCPTHMRSRWRARWCLPGLLLC
jgi:hypothetical protein